MTGVVFDRFDADRLIQRAQAAKMRLHRDKHLAQGSAVRATLFAEDPSASPRAKVFAPAATVDFKTEITKLQGGVQVVDGEGREMSTDTVTYDAAKDHLYTADPVRMQGENFVLTGHGLALSPGEDELKIGGPVALQFEEVISPQDTH